MTLNRQRIFGNALARGANPAWENSICIVVQNNSYQKVAPESFGGILGLNGSA